MVSQAQFNLNPETESPSGQFIRISPYELHIYDPDYYEVLYSQKPRDKYAFYVSQFGSSRFQSFNHRLQVPPNSPRCHEPFFSKQSVNHLEPMLSYMVEKLCGRIDEWRNSGQPMPMRQVYMCLTTDIVTLYAVNHNWHYLDSPDFAPSWVETRGSCEDGKPCQVYAVVTASHAGFAYKHN
jgi:hypothetical protein